MPVFSPQPVLVNNHPEWKVDHIVKAHFFRSQGIMKYLVAWTGYAIDTWEPHDHVKDTQAFKDWKKNNDLDPVQVKGHCEWKVKKILRSRFFRHQNKRKYLVSWEGYGPKHNTWETYNYVKDTAAFKKAVKQWRKDRLN